MSGIKLPLTLSLAGHAFCLALLIMLFGRAPRLPEPIAEGGIEVVFLPALPKTEKAPLPEPPVQPETSAPPAEAPPPEPQSEPVSPAPQSPAVMAEPTPPTPEAAVTASEPPPPPPRKPVVKPPPKPLRRNLEAAQPSSAPAPATPTPPATTTALSQTASAATPVPAPVPAPEASAGYRALLSTWLDSHKRYPNSARQRGEEGRAVLRFAVDRSGRVIDYAVAKSTGYPDLDASIEEMMHGATLPPFPAGMTQPRIEVSVTIRFSLAR